MDKLRQRLQDDARAIEADLSAEVQQRLQARIAATPQQQPVHATGAGLRWAAATAALGMLVFTVMNLVRTPSVDELQLAATPEYVDTSPVLRAIPLRVEPADLTEPLQQELSNLRADVAKARESIERDLRSSF